MIKWIISHSMVLVYSVQFWVAEFKKDSEKLGQGVFRGNLPKL